VVPADSPFPVVGSTGERSFGCRPVPLGVSAGADVALDHRSRRFNRGGERRRALREPQKERKSPPKGWLWKRARERPMAALRRYRPTDRCGRPFSLALATLVGNWQSASGRDFAASLGDDDAVEFRIREASSNARQGYEDGEVRFKLTAIHGSKNEFAVEDRLRPTPSTGARVRAERVARELHGCDS